MKGIILVLTLAFAIALDGSRAQPLSRVTSVAFQQCEDGCQQLKTLLARDTDGGGSPETTGAVDLTGSEIAGSNRECFLCGVEMLMQLGPYGETPSFGGTPSRESPIIHALAFDPPN